MQMPLSVVKKFGRSHGDQVLVWLSALCDEDIFFTAILLSQAQQVLVIDPFSGSGSTALAAHMVGLPVVCADIDPEATSAATWNVARLAALPQYAWESALNLGTPVFICTLLALTETLRRQERSRR